MDKETILDYATNTPENTNRNVLGSMVDSLLRENSGDRLPAVTAEDNGDVLTVVEGAWAKAAPQGGGGVLVLNGTWTSNSELTLDGSYNDVIAADVVVLKYLSSPGSAFVTTNYVGGYGVYEEQYVVGVLGSNDEFTSETATGNLTLNSLM